MKIAVEKYKSIYDKKEIIIDGLAILSGANSSGKSSFMQPFLILKQTLEKQYDSGYLIINGENIKLTDAKQILSKVNNNKDNKFSLFFSEGESSSKICYEYKRGAGFIPKESIMFGVKGKSDITLNLGMKHDEIKSMIGREKEFGFMDEYAKKQKIKPVWKTIKKKCFIMAEYRSPDRKASFFAAGVDPTYQLEKFIRGIIHVPGLRGNPERKYQIADSENVFPGSFEKYVASIISIWSRSKSTEKYTLLVSQLNYLGLASSIKAKRADDTSIEINISRKIKGGDDDCVSVADVGFGVSQTLPVLVALLVAKKGQHVYIEQPELHLHPKAQFKLADIIKSALDRGVKIIIETHSSLLIRGIQTKIARKEIDNSKVSLNWFTQDEETGETIINIETPDDIGAIGDWPSDFDDISLYAEKQYLDAVEESVYGSL
ncbi:AAA family ATPase [Brenneria goodwinii]|uniref:AAA family ATPase n=1 Tax=Brenneria goodwinii TaxID=1109412 RepID=UPI0036ECCEDA